MITIEDAEKKAKDLYYLSNLLGGTINELDSMAKERWQGILDEKEAYETVVLQGENVMVALRQIAMRLDRTVLVKL